MQHSESVNAMHDATQLARRRDAGRILACSESQVLKYERAGLLRRVNLPAVDGKPVRAARYAMADVAALAQRLIDESRRGGDAA